MAECRVQLHAQLPSGQRVGRAVSKIYSWIPPALCALSCRVVKVQQWMRAFFGLAETQDHGVLLSSMNACLLLAENPEGGSYLGDAS